MDISDLGKITIPSFLKYWSSVEPETPAFVFADVQHRVVLTRRDVYTKSKAMGAKLKKIGVNKGDVSAFVSLELRKNTPNRFIIEFGLQMVGAVTVDALGEMKNGKDTIEMLKTTKANVILTDQSYCSVIIEWMKGLNTKITKTEHGFDTECSLLPQLKRVIVSPEGGFDTGREENTAGFIENVEPGDMATIFGTSGTTGNKKMVPHTHYSLLVSSTVQRESDDQSSTHYFCNRPISWAIGYPALYIVKGCTHVMWNRSDYDHRTLYEVLLDEKCNLVFLSFYEVQELYAAYTAKKRPGQFLKTTVIGGQPLTQSVGKKILSFSKSFVTMYGLTETLLVSNMIYFQEDDVKENCIGYPLPSHKLMIVDSNEKEVKQPNQVGELYIKGPSIIEGYLKPDGSLDRHAFTSDGWFKTGDSSFKDSAGRFYVTGRGTDAIRRGDEIFYPYLLENLIKKCPFVEDVIVVAVPDPLLHSEACACVKFATGVDDALSNLRTFVSGLFQDGGDSSVKFLPKHYIEVSAFPLTKCFKKDRTELVRLATSQLHL